MAGLQLWLDADDFSTITESGGSVSAWNDKSGNARHATQTTPANRPTYTASDSRAGNQPSIGSSAVGSNDIGLDIPSMTYSNVYIVTAYKDGSDATFDNFATLIGGPGSFGADRIMGSITIASLVNSSAFDDTAQINDGITSATVLPLPLSIMEFSGSATQSTTLGYNTGATGRSWEGPICEVIYTDGTETPTEREDLLDYLADKWSITLAGDFVPSDVSGLVLHLDPSDASTVTTVGSNASAITDSSPTNMTFTQTTPANRPAYGSRTLNSLNVLDFQIGDLLSGTDIELHSNTDGLSAFVVVDRDSNSTGMNIFGKYDASVAMRQWLFQGNFFIVSELAATFNGDNAVSTTSVGGAQLLDMRWDPGVSLEAQRNMVSRGFAATPANNMDDTTQVVAIPGQPGPGPNLDGGIGEIIVYNTFITSQEATEIRRYLANKWGITL